MAIGGRTIEPGQRETLVVGRARLDGVDDPLTAIADAWRRWGEACVDHLDGDFAFAVWDGGARKLFVARDRFGTRPLVYAHLPGRLLAVAEGLPELLALPELPRRVDEERVADFLAGLADDRASTFYRDVRRLPPAHTLVWEGATPRIRRYWTLEPTLAGAERTDAAWEADYRDRFTTAVRERLRGDGPFAASLSGGLDSSSIVSVASRELADRGGLRTFSLVYPSLPAVDETRWMDAVIAHTGVQNTRILADELSPWRVLDDALATFGEPFFAPNLYLNWALYEAASEAGAKVIFEGFDGDGIVSHGTAWITELVQAGRWIEAAREISGLARVHGLQRRRVALKLGLLPWVPGPLWSAVRAVRPLSTWPPADVIAPTFARRVGLRERLVARREVPPRSEAEAHRQTLGAGWQVLGLELADRSAARFGLELRCPFFDRRLVELTLSLPGSQKLRGGMTRSIARRGLRDLLPPAIAERPAKTDPSPNFHTNLLRMDRESVVGLRDRLDAVAPYLDVGRVRGKIDAYLARGGGPEWLPIWQATTLGRWLGGLEAR